MAPPQASDRVQPAGAHQESWASKVGVILAVAGSAVGLGNFLRFPGLAATNGGGIFLIPYFVSLLLLAVPLTWAEWAMGRYGGLRGHNSAPGIYTMIWPHRLSKYIGVLAIIIPITIYMYYVYIESWCLAYAVEYLRGGMRRIGDGLDLRGEVDAYRAFFDRFVGNLEYGTPSGEGIVFLVIVTAINFYLIYRGLSKGIETFCKVAIPLMIVLALVVLVRVLTLGAPDPSRPEINVNAGLGFMWNPKLAEGQSVWSVLSNPEIWLKAAGQIFFSVSLGFGIILNYASYLKREDDAALSGLTATATNEFCEVCLGGLITIPVAFIFLGPELLDAKLLGSSFSMGFIALPAVFARMPAGDLFGGLWFFMLFLAAITSSLSMLQPGIAFLEQGFNLGRKASVLFLLMIVASGNLLVIYFSKNQLALDNMDFWVGSVCIFILATIQTILFGWVLGRERAMRELQRGALIRIPDRLFWLTVRYLSPAYLLVIFVFWVYKNIPERIRGIQTLPVEDQVPTYIVLGFIGIMFVVFGLLVMLAGLRWEKEGRGVAAARRITE